MKARKVQTPGNNPQLLLVLAAMVVGSMATTAHAVTPGQVSVACGPCHGLTVNGVGVSAGPGSYGFTANVSGRSQAMWGTTIARMVGYGAAVSDVSGTAAYLAGLGAQSVATPTYTPTSLPTNTPVGVAPANNNPPTPTPAPEAATASPPETTTTPAPSDSNADTDCDARSCVGHGSGCHGIRRVLRPLPRTCLPGVCR
jgi:hypothetical protein